MDYLNETYFIPLDELINMPTDMKEHEKLALVDQRLSDLSPKLREHFKESLRHNRRVLERLAKI